MENARIEREILRINERMAEVKCFLHCEDMQWEVKYDSHRYAFYEYVCGKEYYMCDMSHVDALDIIEGVITSIEILMSKRYNAYE